MLEINALGNAKVASTKSTGLPSRIFLVRSLLGLSIIESIRAQSSKKYFDIILTVNEGPYPEIEETFNKVAITTHLSKEFDLVLNLNEIISPIHPLDIQFDTQLNTSTNLFDKVFSQQSFEDLFVPELSLPYISTLTAMFSQTKLSIYFDQISTHSAYAQDSFLGNMHRIKFIYSLGDFAKYMPSNTAQLRSITTDSLRKYILKFGNNNKHRSIDTSTLFINTTSDTLSEDTSRELRINACKHAISSSSSFFENSKISLRVSRHFDEFDFVVIQKWCFKKYRLEIRIIRFEECFLSILLQTTKARVVGFNSIELIAARALTIVPIMVIKNGYLEKIDTKKYDICLKIENLIFQNYFLTGKRKNSNPFLSEQKDTFLQIKSLLYFSHPTIYAKHKDDVVQFLKTCPNDIFAALFPENHFVQEKISITADVWPHVLNIQNSLLKTHFEFEYGSPFIAGLACSHFLSNHKSPERIALLARILLSKRKYKAALNLIFLNRHSISTKKEIHTQVYIFWKLISYYFKNKQP